ncbi:hypothetical protein [Herbidospora galbida]|uniref:hypothetical protein n=1 Tax=Herbidospora galbida TaxID=2575442 RepID=UPI0014857F1B|nr:hypothetical protein [Herbidospora galbida]
MDVVDLARWQFGLTSPRSTTSWSPCWKPLFSSDIPPHRLEYRQTYGPKPPWPMERTP